MSISHRLRRSIALCGLVCAALVTTTAGVAIAASAPAKLYAQERSYSSYGDAQTSGALAQEQYLESYGEPQPLVPPQSPITSDDTPWLPIALSIAGALVVAVSATQLRRLRIRRRHAADSPA